MSGWQARSNAYDLTATKAEWWHRSCSCGARGLHALVLEHLQPAGLRRISGPSANLARLVLDGGDERSTERSIYEALSGRPSLY